ncbi:MAG: cell division protein SepF [Armatimonadetes bacterium]|nr:cell division protein SepF [Armatimonadota bacterium]
MGEGLFNKIRSFFTLEDEEDELVRDQDLDESDVQKETGAGKKRGHLVSLPMRKHEIIIAEPGSLSDAQEVADQIKQRKTIIMNLERIEKGTATRILDFVSGITYALNGTVQRVTDHIFLFAPNGTQVQPVNRKDSKASCDVFPQS